MPLVVLLATFEVVRSLHLGVERIGRYVQVFFEEAGWRCADWRRRPGNARRCSFGPSVPGAGGHPLFLPCLPAGDRRQFARGHVPGPTADRIGDARVPHLAFVVWMLYCDRGMRKQRERGARAVPRAPGRGLPSKHKGVDATRIRR